MKLLYSEGTLFLVPLKGGGYARGVVARSGPKGIVLFGYFFGPRLVSAETVPLDDLDPPHAVLRIRFGDLGLINGKWPICNKIPNWDRSRWPMPDFVMRDPLGRLKPRLVRYSDTDPQQVEAMLAIENDSGLPTNSSSGCGAVEIELNKLLS